MTAPTPDRKKQNELGYLEEARRASSLFPEGEFIPHERPDFLLRAIGGTIGIEVTELCREGPRAEAGRLDKIPDKAKRRYSSLPNAEPVDVSRAFANDANELPFDSLVATVANPVHAHRAERKSRSRLDCRRATFITQYMKTCRVWATSGHLLNLVLKGNWEYWELVSINIERLTKWLLVRS